jgi:hypothetical protein
MPESPLTALATTAQFEESPFANIVRDDTTTNVDALMLRATASIENACSRRMAPFTNLIESHDAEGIDPDEYGDTGGADLPLDIYGALGVSKMRSLGGSSLVRQLQLDQYAPLYTDLWSYSVQTVQLFRTYGDTQFVQPQSLEGPWADTGQFRFRMGTFVPVGTTVVVTYSGGYTVAIPDDLVSACLFAAARLYLLELDPEDRNSGHDLADLDAEIGGLISPYMR